MSRSRTITITVKKKTGDAFDAILQLPPKMMPDAKFDGGWWSFGPRVPACAVREAPTVTAVPV